MEGKYLWSKQPERQYSVNLEKSLICANVKEPTGCAVLLNKRTSKTKKKKKLIRTLYQAQVLFLHHISLRLRRLVMQYTEAPQITETTDYPDTEVGSTESSGEGYGYTEAPEATKIDEGYISTKTTEPTEVEIVDETSYDETIKYSEDYSSLYSSCFIKYEDDVYHLLKCPEGSKCVTHSKYYAQCMHNAETYDQLCGQAEGMKWETACKGELICKKRTPQYTDLRDL